MNTMQHVPGLGEGYWWRTKFNCETGRKNSGRKKIQKNGKIFPAARNELQENENTWQRLESFGMGGGLGGREEECEKKVRPRGERAEINKNLPVWDSSN